MDRDVGSHFNAAVVAVDRLMPADLDILETVSPLLGNQHPDILAQRALIAFEREDAVGLLIDDFLGDVALIADCALNG